LRYILVMGIPVNTPSDLAFWAISIVAVYKVACLLAGIGFGYMGYRLFMAGVLQSAGDLEAALKSKTLKLSRAAPGTFFALFGAAVIAVTIFQGFDIELPGATQQALSFLPEHPPEVTDETPR
jgi:hypothetical protein